MSLRDKTNAALRRATGYSLTRETPQQRRRAIQEAAERAARRARREAIDEERARRGEVEAENRRRANERAEQRQRERAEQQRREREERQEQERRDLEARRADGADLPKHFDDDKRRTIARVRDWTMTTPLKLSALIEATRYVVCHHVPGDVVECGVWRGGSMQAVALTLLSGGDTSRELHLFDTFEGMPPPTEEDARTVDGAVVSAAHLLATSERDSAMWAAASLEDVQRGMAGTAYPAEKVHYHPGLVEQTTPAHAPERIALLRLDTDWYASTKHELVHLYDRLSPGGVLILDDYHSWDGAKKAIDEWLHDTGFPLFMMPMGAGLIAVKPWQ